MSVKVGWPQTPAGLERLQRELAAAEPEPWQVRSAVGVGACYACFARGIRGPGQRDRGWAGAARKEPGRRAETVVVSGEAGFAYEPGVLALREGPLREAAVRALAERPDVLLVDATGRDHPRGAGLALHLGAVLDIPTIGLTDRPLAARAAEPGPARGAVVPMILAGAVVGYALRTRAGVRPVFVSAGWRTDPQDAVEVTLAGARRHRTPQPLREARRAARAARGQSGG